MGASSQRKISSDAGAVAVVPVHGGLGGVGATRATIRDAEFRHTPGHDQSSDTGTQPTKSRMAQARWTERDEIAGVRGSQERVESDATSVQTMGHHRNDTVPMEVDALTKGKGKGKSKTKSKDKSKGETPDLTCFFCKEKGHARKDCPKFATWVAEKKSAGHEQSANSIEEVGWIFALEQEHEELCELIMVDSGASVHVCPPDHGRENGLRRSSETRPLVTASGAEMKQYGMRRVSCDTEVGKITTDYRVLDVRRPIWSLGSMIDSGCDVHFTKNRCWISNDGKELDMIRSGGVFFVAARPSESTSKEANTLELNPMTAAEIEQAALAREHAAFGTPVLRQEPRWTAMENPRCVSGSPQAQQHPQLKRESAARGHRTRTLPKLVSMVHRGASRRQATPEGPATRNR